MDFPKLETSILKVFPLVRSATPASKMHRLVSNSGSIGSTSMNPFRALLTGTQVSVPGLITA